MMWDRVFCRFFGCASVVNPGDRWRGERECDSDRPDLEPAGRCKADQYPPLRLVSGRPATLLACLAGPFGKWM